MNTKSFSYKVVHLPLANTSELETELMKIGSYGWELVSVQHNLYYFKKENF